MVFDMVYIVEMILHKIYLYFSHVLMIYSWSHKALYKDLPKQWFIFV